MDAALLRPWLALIRSDGIGGATAARLLQAFGSGAAIAAATGAQWESAGIPRKLHKAFHEVDQAGIEADLKWLGGDKRGLVTLEDPRYPPQLREIAGAPTGIFYHGDPDLLSMPQLAIVGARSATPQGNENARAFAAELARHGLVITSGLALGIDGAAHRGALDAKGHTIAVCATGLDRVYPARHKQLAHEILEEGLLISEFPVGVQALTEHFPKRNRLISGLALGVLVVEAARESGSLITARLANEQGRDVFAIPGSIHNPMTRGCHALIRQGAKLVETAADILEELAPRIGAHLRAAAPAKKSTKAAADPAEKKIAKALGDQALSFDELLERCNLPAETFNAALLALELRGEVAVSGGRYSRLHRK